MDIFKLLIIILLFIKTGRSLLKKINVISKTVTISNSSKKKSGGLRQLNVKLECYRCRNVVGDFCMENKTFWDNNAYLVKCKELKSCSTAFLYAVTQDGEEYSLQRYCTEEVNCNGFKHYMKNDFPGMKVYCHEKQCGSDRCNKFLYKASEVIELAKTGDMTSLSNNLAVTNLIFIFLFFILVTYSLTTCK